MSVARLLAAKELELQLRELEDLAGLRGGELIVLGLAVRLAVVIRGEDDGGDVFARFPGRVLPPYPFDLDEAHAERVRRLSLDVLDQVDVLLDGLMRTPR